MAEAVPNPPDPCPRATASLDVVIHRMLVTGVTFSLMLVLAGLLLLLTAAPAEGGTYTNLNRITEPPGKFSLSLHELTASASELHGPTIILLGLALLVMTPILRVAVSLVYFWIKRDLWYVALTAIVLFVTLVPAIINFIR